MSLYGKITKDVIIIGTTNIVTNLKSFILIPIIIKILGTMTFGAWVQIVVLLGLISPIAELNLSYTFIRYYAGKTGLEDIREGFYSLFVFISFWSTAITIILLVLSPVLSVFLFNSDEYADILRVGLLTIPFTAVNFLFLYYFRTYTQMKTYSVMVILQNIGEVCLLFPFLYLNMGLYSVVLASLLMLIIIDTIMLLLIMKQIGIGKPRFENLKEHLGFSLPIVPQSISTWLANSSDRFIIGLFLGMAEVGIYSAAYAIGNIISLIMMPIYFVLVPHLSSLYNDNNIQEVRNILSYALKYILMIAIPAAFGLSVLAVPVLKITTKPEFIESGRWIIPVIALSMVILCAYTVISLVITLIKKNRLLAVAWILGGAIKFGLTLILVPVYGVMSAAFATLIAFSFVMVYTAWYSNKFIRLDFNYFFIVKVLLSSCVMSLVILYYNPQSVLEVVAWICIGMAVYVVTLFLLKGVTNKEINFIRGMMNG